MSETPVSSADYFRRIGQTHLDISQTYFDLADYLDKNGPGPSPDAPEPNGLGPNGSKSKGPKPKDPGLMAEADRIRGLKEKNVSWAQIRRGTTTLLGGHVPYAASEARKRANDRSLTRALLAKAGVSEKEMLAILDEAELGY